MEETKENVQYAGFWIRVLAIIIDSIIIGIVFYPILAALFPAQSVAVPEMERSVIYDPATNIRNVVLIVYSILMLHYYDATLGKKLLGLKVIGENGKKPTILDLIIRETIGKFISAFVLALGFIWVGFDPKKQGWHDKLAKTVVVYSKK